MNNRITVDVNKKIRSRSGESIAETLVALLISAFALVMLAGAISAGSRIVKNSRDKLDTYYKNNEKLVKMLETDGTGGQKVKIEDSNSPGTDIEESIIYYQNNTFTNKPVLAYRHSSN